MRPSRCAIICVVIGAAASIYMAGSAINVLGEAYYAQPLRPERRISSAAEALVSLVGSVLALLLVWAGVGVLRRRKDAQRDLTYASAGYGAVSLFMGVVLLWDYLRLRSGIGYYGNILWGAVIFLACGLVLVTVSLTLLRAAGPANPSL